MLKSDDLTEVAVFEFDTVRYDPELYHWTWNKRNNLEGYLKFNKEHMFTWQPHGSQFTIIEKVPDDSLVIQMKNPPALEKAKVLEAIGFDRSWVSVRKKEENINTSNT